MATRVVVMYVSAETEGFSTHAEPIWRDRADFIINARLPEPGRFEQLWARGVSEREFEICCIPFFVYDLALGDLVETQPQGGRKHVLKQVVRKSGRWVFRAFFERTQRRYRTSTIDALEALGAQTEWSSAGLLAVDIETSGAQQVADLLHGLEQQGRLVYETGKTQ